MKAKIDMIGILTSQFDEMLMFYKEVLGFTVSLKMDHFAEFEHEGVRFALSTNSVMEKATGEKSYAEERKGHSFELAFRAVNIEEVDSIYKELVQKGAKPIKDPENMPWGQRTAFFADPDGNIHEIFSDL